LGDDELNSKQQEEISVEKKNRAKEGQGTDFLLFLTSNIGGD
jgi:hypothetical protein